ncbi:hypothetical protein HAX54_038827, partial [Datura stramonium]|nr:hypothetical protein [Datura stramonium]
MNVDHNIDPMEYMNMRYNLLFSHLFLKKFIHPSQREELRGHLEHLRRGDMTAIEYEMQFVELSSRATILLLTELESMRRFYNSPNQEVALSEVASSVEIWGTSRGTSQDYIE